MRIPTAATTDQLCLKIRELAARSPNDLAALDILVDMVLERLDAQERPRRYARRQLTPVPIARAR